MTMGSRPGKIYAFFLAGAPLPCLLLACSAAPLKMECQQLRSRIEYENMSEDQMRFARQELEDCEDRLREAQRKDSATVDNTEKRFTPKDSE
jgi:hypothetical protein